jgi:hypothetical protein
VFFSQKSFPSKNETKLRLILSEVDRFSCQVTPLSGTRQAKLLAVTRLSGVHFVGTRVNSQALILAQLRHRKAKKGLYFEALPFTKESVHQIQRKAL